MHSLSFSSQTLAILAVLPTLVRSHGYVTKMTFGSNTVETWAPFVDPYADPVPNKPTRKINSDGPVEDVNASTLACGIGADSPVGTVVKGVKAGEEVTAQWTTWPEDHRGPVMTYMASCNGDCTKFDATKGKWFKIDEKGYENGKWATDTLIEQGSSYKFTIPASLKSGDYILRHEILALHSAYAQNGAQFYPSCNQISLTSSGTQQPDGVSFPGAYSANDPGILLSIYNGISSYKIPGPAVISAASTGGSSSGSSSGSGSSASNSGSGDSSDDDSSSGSSPTASSGSSSGGSNSGSSDESSDSGNSDSGAAYGSNGSSDTVASDSGASDGSAGTAASAPTSTSSSGSKGGHKHHGHKGHKSHKGHKHGSKTSATPAPTPTAEDGADDGSNYEQPAAANEPPALVTSQPALITSQPALITSQPPLVTSQPPLVTSQPPLVTSQPPLVTEIPGLKYRALAAASVPTKIARALPRQGNRLPVHVL